MDNIPDSSYHLDYHGFGLIRNKNYFLPYALKYKKINYDYKRFLNHLGAGPEMYVGSYQNSDKYQILNLIKNKLENEIQTKLELQQDLIFKKLVQDEELKEEQRKQNQLMALQQYFNMTLLGPTMEKIKNEYNDYLKKEDEFTKNYISKINNEIQDIKQVDLKTDTLTELETTARHELSRGIKNVDEDVRKIIFDILNTIEENEEIETEKSSLIDEELIEKDDSSYGYESEGPSYKKQEKELQFLEEYHQPKTAKDFLKELKKITIEQLRTKTEQSKQLNTNLKKVIDMIKDDPEKYKITEYDLNKIIEINENIGNKLKEIYEPIFKEKQEQKEEKKEIQREEVRKSLNKFERESNAKKYSKLKKDISQKYDEYFNLEIKNELESIPEITADMSLEKQKDNLKKIKNVLQKTRKNLKNFNLTKEQKELKYATLSNKINELNKIIK